MKVLGIESSCDETAVAIVSYENNQAVIEHSEIYSQVQEHKDFGGVVPELAARAHIERLPYLFNNLPLHKIDAVATTTGPGLIGGLHVGYSFGRGLALALNKPFYPIHHLEAHALTVRLTNSIDFPYLLLLISGGHTQIIDIKNFRQYRLLGETKDDSCGEVFDKTAKMLNLGFPGGPAIEKVAKAGNPFTYNLPCPFYKQSHCDFSFSGLKTAIKDIVAKDCHTKDQIANLCASIQHTVAKILTDRLSVALNLAPHKKIVIAGGVAANLYIREQLHNFCMENACELVVPPVKLCTDNAAMIAWVGIEQINHKIEPSIILPTPRWSLTSLML